MKTVTRSAIICAMNASQYDRFVALEDHNEEVRRVSVQRNDAHAKADELDTKNAKLRSQLAIKEQLTDLLRKQRDAAWERENNLNGTNGENERTISDLRARLEAAEAQLKYGSNEMLRQQVQSLTAKLVEITTLYARPMMFVDSSPCVDLSGSSGKFRTRTGATYEYNPRTKQVLVDAREFEQLHTKASIYREGVPVGTIDYNRDTIVVDRSTWTRLSSDKTLARKSLHEIAIAVGKEGAFYIDIVEAVKENLSTLNKARKTLKHITDTLTMNYGDWYAVSCIRNIIYEYNKSPKPTTGEKSATPGSSR